MGGLESRFNALLLEGKSEEALQFWNDNPDFHSTFRPNCLIKYSPSKDSPLHCAVRHEMKVLAAIFLEHGGDPFTRNANGETPVHLVCRSAKFSSRRSKRRAEILQELLDKIVPESYSEEEVVGQGEGAGSVAVKRNRLLESWSEGAGNSGLYAGGSRLNLGVQDKVCVCVCVE